MINPCKECIVQAACNKRCDVLVDYLIERLDTKHLTELSYENYEFVADGLRQNNMALTNDDTRINWIL